MKEAAAAEPSQSGVLRTMRYLLGLAPRREEDDGR
jgi:hypothetical protein